MDWNNQFEFPSPFIEPIYRIGPRAGRITEKTAVLMEPVDSTTVFTQAPLYDTDDCPSTVLVLKNIGAGTEGPSPRGRSIPC